VGKEMQYNSCDGRGMARSVSKESAVKTALFCSSPFSSLAFFSTFSSEKVISAISENSDRLFEVTVPWKA